MPCLQLQVVMLHVLCACAEPHPSLDLIPALQCRTPKPVDDTTDDLLSLAHCSETGVTVAALLLVLRWLSLPCRKAALIEAYKELFVLFFFAWVKKWSGPVGPLPMTLLVAQPLTYTHPSLCSMSIIVSLVPELPSKSFESGTKSPAFSVKVNQSPILSLESPSKSYPYM